MLGLWMIAGLAHVRKQEEAAKAEEERPEGKGDKDKRHNRVYMDDRSWVNRRTKAALRAIEQWRTFSSRVGLKENEGKTQIAAKGKKCKEELEKQRQEAAIEKSSIKDEVEILGVVTAKTRRKLAKKEKERLQEATRRADRLSTLQVSRVVKRVAVQTFVLPKAAYGWVARVPPKAEVGKLTAAVWKAVRKPRPAAVPLAEVLEGRDLLTLIATRQFSIISRLRKQEKTPWTKRPQGGTALGCLRATLGGLGWTLVSPWKWRHGGLKETLQIEEADKGKHLIRESYRYQQLRKFLGGKRREAKELKGTVVDYCKYNVGKTRRRTEAVPEYRAVAMGGVPSPAVMEKGGKEENCPHCGKAWATHEHVFWTCPLAGWEGEPPQDRFVRRFGWYRYSQTSEENDNIASHMEGVVRKIWENRWGKRKTREAEDLEGGGEPETSEAEAGESEEQRTRGWTDEEEEEAAKQEKRRRKERQKKRKKKGDEKGKTRGRHEAKEDPQNETKGKEQQKTRSNKRQGSEEGRREESAEKRQKRSRREGEEEDERR